MAVYTYQNAIDVARQYVKSIPVQVGTSGFEVDLIACDTINSMIWSAFPWRWSVKSVSPTVALVDGTQDYGAAADFYRLLAARIIRTDITPNKHVELNILEFLSPNLTQKFGQDQLQSLAFVTAPAKLRLNAAAGIATGVTLTLEYDYQYIPTKVTDRTASMVVPDHYFDVFVQGLRWKFYDFAGDTRAGSMNIDREGRKQYTGELGKFYDDIDEMKRREDYGLGQAIRFPDEPMGWVRPLNPGLFQI